MNTNKYEYFEFTKIYNEQQGNISQLSILLGKERPTIRAWIKRMNADTDMIEKALSNKIINDKINIEVPTVL